MGDSRNIHNLLQTGYFTSSRAKNGQTPSVRSSTPPLSDSVSALDDVPRSYEPTQPRRRTRPPPPIVEDELESLAREHGSAIDRASDAGDLESRGEVDQYPILLEVHEHNPERRFVILKDADEAPKAAAQDKTSKSKGRQSPAPSDGGKSDTASGRKCEPELNGKLGVEREKGDGRERRRSRHDLPPLETNLRPDRQPNHHRTRSAVNPDPGDYFSSRPVRQSRQYGGQLSPEIVKHGSGRREKAYYDYPSSSRPRSPILRSQPMRKDDRKHEDEYERRGSARPPVRRTISDVDAGKLRRRVSNDVNAGVRQRDYPSTRSSTREPPKDHRRNDADRTKPQAPYKAREGSQSSDEYSQTSRNPRRLRPKSIVIQQDRDPLLSPPLDGAKVDARSRSRAPKGPPASPRPTGFPEEMMNPRGTTTTLPIPDGQRNHRERPASFLPYPDDDPFQPTRAPAEGGRTRPGRSASKAPPTVSMPEIPARPETPIGTPTLVGSPSASSPGAPHSWQPPAFDPGKDGVRVDRPIGTYRRYSENNGANGTQKLPECPRTKPVAGMADWLMLPRTDFNICPTCYDAVFDRSEYRTQFQPVQRPSDRPIACDFGSSPWYRIAWLLTMKHQSLDLRLFHQIANVSAASRTQSCPGNRRSTRNWLTVKDPDARRPVRDFTVCPECAKTVEALLPNLTGVFIPADSRSEPTRGICALHFTPERRRFVLYFDALETTSERALAASQAPDISDLASALQKLSVSECREDSPIPDGYWHNMQFLPEFTVCKQCFEEAVRPRLEDDSVIARNFYTKQQKLPLATCQLYSPRMRDIFKKACAWNDPKYLEDKVRQRMNIEADIHAKLVRLDKEGHKDKAWTEDQVSKLIREWQKWE